MTLTNQGLKSVAVVLVCFTVSALAVILRFWCKLILRAGLHGDDWWSLTAVIAYAGLVCAYVWGIFCGGQGLDMSEIAAELAASPSAEKVHELQDYLESLFISVTFSWFVLYAVKISILLLYRRIFSTRRYRIVSAILMAISSVCSDRQNSIFFLNQPKAPRAVQPRMMTMDADADAGANTILASIVKASPDRELTEEEENDMFPDIEEECEAEDQYCPEPGQSSGVLFPVCIGDIIYHPGARYQIVHRLGKGGFSVVWLAHDLQRNTSVALKVMMTGPAGEKEFENQRILKRTADLDKSRLNLYQDTFHLASPYNVKGRALYHRVLVLPLAGPSLGADDILFKRSLRCRMAAAKSLLEALRDLHRAGFVHGDINLGNVMWTLHPTAVKEITTSPAKVFPQPMKRIQFEHNKGLKSGHRLLPATFPVEKLGSQVVLADFGLLLADQTTVEHKLQGTPAFIAPERFHDHDPTKASDLWSFMVVFVHLYLCEEAFPPRWMMSRKDPVTYLYSIRENLGPLPAEWATTKYDREFYAPSPEDQPDKFASRLYKDWQEAIPTSIPVYKERAQNGDPEAAATAKRLEQDMQVKKKAEPYALKVIHKIFRYQPRQRLTTEQLLVDPDWIQLMKICGV
ncbi:hypothetical protein VMCG_03986 [Cytospora schulzeri]|uniref:Protein kinase domain-containing protein n=1 Tax=Cytospora schulzeri TaxID=448051 RepID=A0A423WUA6_9PEZI|nr:hypothetical protein VMCG_03986 [Valsa malicola]